MIPYTVKRSGLKGNHHHIERGITMMIRDNKSGILEGNGALLVILTEDVQIKRGDESEKIVRMTLVITIGEEEPREERGHVRERKGITGDKNDRDMTHTQTQIESSLDHSDIHYFCQDSMTIMHY